MFMVVLVLGLCLVFEIWGLCVIGVFVLELCLVGCLFTIGG